MVSISILVFLGVLALGSSLPFVEEIHGYGRGHAHHSTHITTHTHAHGVECAELHLAGHGLVGGGGPPPPPPRPDGPPLCSCQAHCDEKLRSFTDLVVRNRATQMVCSETFTTLCCNEFDPWPGVTDTFAHLAPCVPETQCRRPYGAAATDVRDFGVIGPCPGGFGVVRCLDGIAPEIVPQPIPVPLPVPVPQPTGPIHIVLPIIEHPQPLPPKPELPPPPPAETATQTPTAATETTLIPAQPTPVFVPPVTYDPPAPAVPQPSVTYDPPAPVPVPEPSVTYDPPTPVVVQEPSGGYLPPSPVPISTSYGVPLAEPLGEHEHYYGYTSRFGFPYAYRRYPDYAAYSGLGGGAGGGFHFRLNKYKSFGLFG